MGTAVLHPQDCLRSRSRLKIHTSGMIYPCGSSSRASRRNHTASSHRIEAGLLPLPDRTRSSPSSRHVQTKGHESQQVKGRRVHSPQEKSSVAADSSVFPLYRILQRSKGDSASDEFAVIEGITGPQGDATDGVYRSDHSSSAVKMKDSCRSAQGLHFNSTEALKHSKTVVDNKFKISSSVLLAAAPPVMVKGVGKQDLCIRAVMGLDGKELEGVTCLRRTATEPVLAPHRSGQSTRKAMHISGSRPKSEILPICKHGATLSCEERWAGPAYSSSPPPSSLPLPKLFLPHVTVSSGDIPPLTKQYSAGVYMESLLQPPPVAVVACVNTGASDVAFATRSLRRLLNLDPY